MSKEIYRCDLCRREGEVEDYPCYSFEYPQGKCLHGCTDEPEWEPMCTEAKLDKAVQAEREACAKVCDIYIKKLDKLIDKLWAGNRNIHMEGLAMGADECADLIRKRGE